MDELFWIFGSKVPQKHLFSASGVLKKAQNRHKLKVFIPHTGMLFLEAHDDALLSKSMSVMNLFKASGGLKRAINMLKFRALNPLQLLGCFFVFLGGI